MQVDVKVAQLLCSRLCHDLVSPIGAVNAGLELIEEGADADGRAIGLIATSAGEASRRLSFFRMAFGLAAGAAGEAPLKDARGLAAGLLRGGKATLDWPAEADADGASLPPDAAKVVLNMVLIASESLPRGGVIGVRTRALDDGLGVAVTAAGTGAKLRDDIGLALNGKAAGDDLTARNAHAHYAQCLARDLGAAIEAEDDAAGEVRLVVLIPTEWR